MKKLLLYNTLVILLFVNGCTIGSSFKIEERYESIEHLTESSSLIVEGIVVSRGKVFDYEGVEFIKTEFDITNFIRKPDGFQENTIIILQTNSAEDMDPRIKKHRDYVLFLRKYEGPVIDDAYVIVGLLQGQFILVGEEIRGVHNHNELSKEEDGKWITYDKLIEIENEYKYKQLIKENTEIDNESEKDKQDQ